VNRFVHLGAGFARGMTGLSAGYAIGCVGNVVRACMRRTARAWASCTRARIAAGSIPMAKPTPATHGASFDAEVSTSVRVNRCTGQRVLCTGNACMLAVTLSSPSVYESDIGWTEAGVQWVQSPPWYWYYAIPADATNSGPF
jgi:hypothetical protein